MRLRDMFACDDEEQRARVDGPSIREVAAAECDPVPGQVDEREVYFTSGLPGDDQSNHPDLPAFNPYLFVPWSELEYLLKNKKDLSSESRQRIMAAIRALQGA